MAMDRPHVSELLEAVQEFLTDKITPQLSGFDAFQMRIINNVLDIARREVTHNRACAAAETARLQALFETEDTYLDALNRRLCTTIRKGQLPLDDPQLLAHLWASTLDKVAIDQPRYATYRREAQKRGHTLP